MADSAREMENLLYTYAARIDAGDLDGVAALFAHGRIEAAPGVTFEGRDEVRGMYEASTRLYPDDGTPKTKHMTTNVRVTVDDETGTAESDAYYSVCQATPDLPLQIIITGRYHDTFQRIEGQWWFDTRTMFVDQLGDLSHHLKYELPG